MQFIKNTGLFLASALILASCGQKGDTVETKEAQEVTASEGQSLAIDTSTSEVSWKGYKPAGRHNGIIPITSGEVKVAGDDISGGKFVFDITKLEIHDLEEGSENYGKLHGHLQSDDFFDAANHPEAIFEVTAVEPFTSTEDVDDKEEFETDHTPNTMSEQMVDNPTHWISGNLTMRGTTKNIKFPAHVQVQDGMISAKAGFNIDRTEWGLSYGDESTAADKAKDKFIYNTVNVGFNIHAN